MQLCKGRPDSVSQRIQDETAVYDLLEKLDISYWYTDHLPADTMELCREVDQVLYPAVICKNLFLCNTQQTRFYLLLLRGDKKFVTKNISKQAGSSRLSFGPSEKMVELLHCTPGSASIMGLIHDADHQVQLLVDRDVLEAEWFGCHPCTNTTSLKIRTEDVFTRLLNELKREYIVVEA